MIKLDILILLETMVNCQNVELTIKRLGYIKNSTILPYNNWGAIWCLWNEENIKVTVIAKATQTIHCMVYEKFTTK